ncbi:hypothetical protein ACFVX6_39860 [Streptomyces sp. NPDC058289]|uniref:hypothetical protein n=1 Tax=Streptomyces sp. NPDC058289 TaxID=3346425 RepID=UPI0036EFDE00
MIPPHNRTKEAVPVLGARTHGKIGPSGPYGGKIEGDVDDRDQAHVDPHDLRTDH